MADSESTSSTFSTTALILVFLFAAGVLALVYFGWYRPSQGSSTYVERNSTVVTPGEKGDPGEKGTPGDSAPSPEPAPSEAPPQEPAPANPGGGG